MSTQISPTADAARESARQDNGQFGTQHRAEADVDLTGTSRTWPTDGVRRLADELSDITVRYDSRLESEIHDIADRVTTDDFDPEAYAEELDDIVSDLDDRPFVSSDTESAAIELTGIAKQLRAGDFGPASEAPATTPAPATGFAAPVRSFDLYTGQFREKTLSTRDGSTDLDRLSWDAGLNDETIHAKMERLDREGLPYVHLTRSPISGRFAGNDSHTEHAVIAFESTADLHRFTEHTLGADDGGVEFETEMDDVDPTGDESCSWYVHAETSVPAQG